MQAVLSLVGRRHRRLSCCLNSCRSVAVAVAVAVAVVMAVLMAVAVAVVVAVPNGWASLGGGDVDPLCSSRPI